MVLEEWAKWVPVLKQPVPLAGAEVAVLQLPSAVS
jgi:hypothetical protein